MAEPEGIRARLSHEQIREAAGKIDMHKSMIGLAKSALMATGHASKIGGGAEAEVIHERLEPKILKALEDIRSLLSPDVTPKQLQQMAAHIVLRLIEKE